MPSSGETMGDASVPQVRLAGSLVRKSSINEKKILTDPGVSTSNNLV
jgi:hypothetical protein